MRTSSCSLLVVVVVVVIAVCGAFTDTCCAAGGPPHVEGSEDEGGWGGGVLVLASPFVAVGDSVTAEREDVVGRSGGVTEPLSARVNNACTACDDGNTDEEDGTPTAPTGAGGGGGPPSLTAALCAVEAEFTSWAEEDAGKEEEGPG